MTALRFALLLGLLLASLASEGSAASARGLSRLGRSRSLAREPAAGGDAAAPPAGSSSSSSSSSAASSAASQLANAAKSDDGVSSNFPAGAASSSSSSSSGSEESGLAVLSRLVDVKSPTKELGSVLNHTRDNIEGVQSNANRAYNELKTACDQAVDGLIDEVRPVQASLLSTKKLITERKKRIEDNKEAMDITKQSLDVLGAKLAALSLRKADLTEQRSRARHVYDAKVRETEKLIATVTIMMTQVSNAHHRLNMSIADEQSAAAAAESSSASLIEVDPAPTGPLVTSDKLQMISHSFKLLNLLRHELSQYLLMLPTLETESHNAFSKVADDLAADREAIAKLHAEALKTFKAAQDENAYLAKFIPVLESDVPEIQKKLATLQSELRDKVEECEEERHSFRRTSIDRKQQLETLTEVQREIARSLDDSDFLPPAPAKPHKVKVPKVKNVVDPDMGTDTAPPNKDAVKPAPPAPVDNSEANQILG